MMSFLTTSQPTTNNNVNKTHTKTISQKPIIHKKKTCSALVIIIAIPFPQPTQPVVYFYPVVLCSKTWPFTPFLPPFVTGPLPRLKGQKSTHQGEQDHATAPHIHHGREVPGGGLLAGRARKGVVTIGGGSFTGLTNMCLKTIKPLEKQTHPKC